MKVLIIEDSCTKEHDIKKALSQFGIYDVICKSTKNEGLYELLESFKNDEPYSLLVLDMQFPELEGLCVKPDAGIDVLKEIKRRKWDIPVIMCSTEKFGCMDMFPNVAAEIKYDPAVSLESAFKQALTAYNNRIITKIIELTQQVVMGI